MNKNHIFLDCSYNFMSSEEDVNGMQGKGLIPEETFVFLPQKEINILQ